MGEELRRIDTGKHQSPEAMQPGPAPMLEWVAIEKLVIDDGYQRDLKTGNWKAINRIAENFRWSRFSPVFIAPVEGGRFAIIDGQHRTHAAALCGFKEVPCQVVQMSREEQAAAFAAVNGLVTKVTTWQIFRAAKTAGEEWAVRIADCAAAAGCKVMSSNTSHWQKQPGEIYAVRMFRKVVDAFGPEAVTKALKIMMAADGYRDNSEIWDAMIVRAMVSALCGRPPVLDNPKAVRAIEDFDIFAVIERINTVTRDRIRRGLPYIAKGEQLETAITAMLDRKLPARMALPEVLS